MSDKSLLKACKSILVFVCALFLFSCNNPNEIGLELQPEQEDIKVKYIELPVQTSTIIKDSVITSLQQSRFLCGKYDDPVFGEVQAEAYTQIRPLDLDANISGSEISVAVFDSLVLNLRISYQYGNSIEESQTLYIHQLTEDIPDTVSYYNFQKHPYSQGIIGEKSFLFTPGVDTVVSITLSDELGLELLDKAKKTKGFQNEFDNIESFQETYKGFAVVPGPENNIMFGFDPSDALMQMNLFYHIPTDTADKVDSLGFAFFSVNYHNYISPNSESASTKPPLDIITAPNEVYLSDDAFTYLQAGSGFTPILDLAGFFSFADTIEHMLINRAELVIEDVEPYEAHVSPPTSIAFFLTHSDNNNEVLFSKKDGFPLSIQQESYYANSYLNPFDSLYLYGQNALSFPYDEEAQSYSGDVTLFLQYLYDGLITENQLLMVPNRDASSVNRVVIDKNKIKLKIYYTTLTE